MLMRNIDVSQGLINGSRGSISDLIRDGDGRVLSLMVNFDQIPDREIPIKRCSVNRYMQFGRKRFSVFQFPIRLGWAVTAHKSQGQTVSRVAINITEGAFAHGAFYVAISRVKRLEDMILFGAEEWPVDGIRFHINEFIRETEGKLRDRWRNVEETPEDDF
jgi:ATP-dependent exoDNAse (exonuclease V) alpha subunit